MLQATVLLFLSFFGISAPASASCPSVQTSVTVDPAFKGMNIDHSKPRSHLAQTMKQVPFAGFAMQGLTVLDFTTAYRISVTMTEIEEGRWCASLDKVTAEFGLKEPAKVMIASEIRRGTCEYRTVLDHERTHVAIGERSARAGSAQMKAALLGLAARSFPVEAGSKDEAYRIAREKVEAAVNDSARKAIERADRENAGIDTKDSYDRLARLCR